jgi:hypothetical protein
METVVQKLLRFQVGSSSVLIATLALLTTLVWVNPGQCSGDDNAERWGRAERQS